MSIPNRPHGGHHSAVSCSEHPCGEVDGLIRELLLSSTGLARRQECEVGVLEVLLRDSTQRERPFVEAESTLQGLSRILRGVTCEVDAAIPLHVGETFVYGDCVAFKLQNLRMYDEALAQRVAEVSKALEIAGTSTGLRPTAMDLSEKITMEQQVRAHWDSAREWEELLTTVRSIQGFEDFLRPPTCSSLLTHLPIHGPIVVINVHKDRCDAIAMFDGMDEPVHIPLPDFSSAKASDYHAKLHSRLQAQGLRMREESENVEFERAIGKYRRRAASDKDIVKIVLRGLWNEVVKPILDVLCFSVSGSTCAVGWY